MIPVTSTDVGTARDGPAETNEPLGADGALASDAGNDTAPVDAGAPPCFDDMQDGDESDVDCGGSVCSPCLPFWRCRGPSDCLGNSCDPDSLLCRPSCTDGFRDGDESDVDCGGSCPKCALYKDCSLASDCRTGICAFWDHGDHCLPPDTCHDGARDGGETDVDCGGPYCIWCFSGQGCVLDADCSRKACVAGRCS
ncbi:MAG TPA: hypothetical protein VFH68_03635 [Polyangia bacterium]|jgi:hypothetical protein|nr:hypothetical protein [Polyangia bacterium]